MLGSMLKFSSEFLERSAAPKWQPTTAKAFLERFYQERRCGILKYVLQWS